MSGRWRLERGAAHPVLSGSLYPKAVFDDPDLFAPTHLVRSGFWPNTTSTAYLITERLWLRVGLRYRTLMHLIHLICLKFLDVFEIPWCVSDTLMCFKYHDAFQIPLCLRYIDVSEIPWYVLRYLDVLQIPWCVSNTLMRVSNTLMYFKIPLCVVDSLR